MSPSISHTRTSPVQVKVHWERPRGRASAGQSLKGLITAGGARAAAYVGAKLLRRAAG